MRCPLYKQVPSTRSICLEEATCISQRWHVDTMSSYFHFDKTNWVESDYESRLTWEPLTLKWNKYKEILYEQKLVIILHSNQMWTDDKLHCCSTLVVPIHFRWKFNLYCCRCYFQFTVNRRAVCLAAFETKMNKFEKVCTAHCCPS